MKKYIINTSFHAKNELRGELIYIEAYNLDEALEIIKQNGHKYDSFRHIEITNPIQVLSRKIY